MIEISIDVVEVFWLIFDETPWSSFIEIKEKLFYKKNGEDFFD